MSAVFIIQIVSALVLSVQFSQIYVQQQELEHGLRGYITSVEQQSHNSIQEISRELVKQREEIEDKNKEQTTLLERLAILESSQSDLSSLVEATVSGVVSITTDRSAGTGFIVSDDGYAITNYHVIADSLYVKVIDYDEQIHDAELIAFDSDSDLAVLKMTGSFIPLALGDSDSVEIGERVIAIGNPLGLSFTVTEGIISGLNRVGPNGREDYIQTDVTLNPGNSGGPLINTKGEVIGVNNFKLGNAEALGFALESNVLKEYITLLNITIS